MLGVWVSISPERGLWASRLFFVSLGRSAAVVVRWMYPGLVALACVRSHRRALWNRRCCSRATCNRRCQNASGCDVESAGELLWIVVDILVQEHRGARNEWVRVGRIFAAMGASKHRTVARGGHALFFSCASLTRRSVFCVLTGASRWLAQWYERRSGNSANGDLSGGVGERWCYEEGSPGAHVAFFFSRSARTSMTAGGGSAAAGYWHRAR